VINDRWRQLLFGFYPSHLYWRPVLALALMFVALAPVLFPGLPRKLFWFSAAYPFLAYWLLWGGSIWLPVWRCWASSSAMPLRPAAPARRALRDGRRLRRRFSGGCSPRARCWGR
jgi:hypothetical protein